MSTRSRRNLGRLILALAVPTGLVLLCEGVARWIPEDEPAGIWHDPYFRPLHHPAGTEREGQPLESEAGHGLWSNDRAMEVYATEAHVGRRFTTVEKDAGTIRVFCFGGSSTYGLVFAPRLSFSRLLEARLGLLLPDRKVEVVNAGISGYDSHDLPRVAEESLAFAPDVWVVYAGHNELKYPNLGRVKSPFLSGLLERSALVRRVVPPSTAPPVPGVIEFEPFLTEAEFERSRSLYRGALEELHDMATRHDIRLVVCTPVSNVRDKEPRLTVLAAGGPSEREQRRQQLQELRGRYGVLLRAGDRPEIDADQQRADRRALDQLLAVEPEAAMAHFLSARLALREGNLVEARAAFERSQEWDGLPERATPALIAALREFAGEANVTLIDTAAHLANEAEGQVPGFDLFLDYCHPTVEGHWWLADGILRGLAAHDVVAPAAEYQWSREPVDDRLTFYLELLQFREEEVVDGKVEGAMARIGEALEKVERREDLLAIAEEWLEGALRMDPDHARARLLLGLVWAMRGDPTLAWQWIEQGQQRSPEVAVELATLVGAHPLLRELLKSVGILVQDTGFVRAESGT